MNLEESFKEQKFAAAFDVAAEAIQKDGTDWNALYLAGVTHRLRGDSVSAISFYRRALRHNSSESVIWQALGIALQSLGQFSESVQALTTAIRLDPDSYASHNSLGLTYKLARDYPSAMRAYDAALHICANRAFAQLRRDHPEFFSLEHRGDSKVLIINRAYMESMRRILVTDFDYFNTVRNMITCCIQMGDHRKARELQEHADTCTPIDMEIIGPIPKRFK